MVLDPVFILADHDGKFLFIAKQPGVLPIDLSLAMNFPVQIFNDCFPVSPLARGNNPPAPFRIHREICVNIQGGVAR